MLVAYILFGAMMGSFLNVCIHRIPLEGSILSPRSTCPKCNSTIPFYDNIPVISYLVLKGKCRSCGQAISLRYPLVEILTAGFTTAVGTVFGMTPLGGVYIVFIYILIVITVIDLDHMIIPDRLVGLGLIIGIAAIFVGAIEIGWKDAFMGSFFYGGFLYLAGMLGKRIFKKEAMGMGDVKLGVMMGLLLGWKMSVMSLYLSFLVASIVGLTAIITGQLSKGDRIPFGPFLAVGTVLTIFFGQAILEIYLSFMTP
jgi:leader peptidase (prepilin peptidase)/N-methyltransferase